MNTIKSRIILSTLCALFSAYLFLITFYPDPYKPTWHQIINFVMATGFASSCLALLSKGRFKFLNNMALLCIGLPSLAFIGFFGWMAYQGTLNLTIGGVLFALMCVLGIVSTGSITEDEEARCSDIKEGAID